MPTASELEALKLVPLRQDVPWIDLSLLFPGTICENIKNPEHGKFGAVDLGSAEAAARIVELHNQTLEKGE